LLPAGAVAGWGLHPLENAALARRTPIPAVGGDPVIGNRSILSAIVLLLIAGTTFAELTIVKYSRLPILRTSIVNAELLPSIVEAFYRWRFEVPIRDEWKAEFLSMTHENIFWTQAPCYCDDSCNKEQLDEETSALIEKIPEDRE
jgi:hypothetical protein